MSDLESFRQETRAWLQENVPSSIVGVRFSELDGNWGGRRAEYANPDMKVWLERMALTRWAEVHFMEMAALNPEDGPPLPL